MIWSMTWTKDYLPVFPTCKYHLLQFLCHCSCICSSSPVFAQDL